MPRTLVLWSVLLLALAGCGDEPEASPSPSLTTIASPTPSPSPVVIPTPSPSPVVSVSPTPSPLTPTTTPDDSGDIDGDTTPFPANTATDTGDPAGEPSTITDVRVGRHEGYDRVVFDAAGGGTPGWTVGYVDEALAQGSGEPVAVAGDAILEVTLTNTGYPADTGVDEFAADLAQGAGVVTEVRYVGVYEGRTQAFVGLDEQRPFRVRALDEGQDRVLVEVVR